MRGRSLFWAIVLLCAGLLPPVPSARGGERYYAMVFGSQTSPKRLRYTHTWATFVRVMDDPGVPGACQVYQHSISWLPETLEVRVWNLFPEPGVNLDLYATLAEVYRQGQSVTMWGPFEIEGPIYERSLGVKRILDSHTARYRAISTPRNLLVSDCIHAVTAVDPQFGRGHYPLIRIGNPASRFIARQVVMRSAFDQHQTNASWLIPWLGLDRYPIEVVPPRMIPRRGCVLCRCPDRA
jgi:hypothetical protein